MATQKLGEAHDTASSGDVDTVVGLPQVRPAERGGAVVDELVLCCPAGDPELQPAQADRAAARTTTTIGRALIRPP